MNLRRLSVVGMSVLAAAAAFADGPTNDEKSNAIQLPGESGSRSDGNMGATYNATDDWVEDDWRADPATVWYWWLAPRDGYVVFDTIGSGFDTWIGVGGEDGSLLDYNDDGCYDDGTDLPDNLSRLRLFVEGGKCYYIQVCGYEDDSGTFNLNWSQEKPANDDMGSALAISGGIGYVEGWNYGATSAAGDWACDHADFSGCTPKTVWFKWTAPASGMVDFDTIGSNFDTWLAIGTESGGLFACNDDGLDDYGNKLDDGASRLQVQVESGTTYLVLLSGFGEAAGDYELSWRMEASAPTNDDVSNATMISGETGMAFGTNSGTTSAPGDWAYDNWDGSYTPATVWFRWTAPKSGFVDFDTVGSDFDTWIAIGTDSAGIIEYSDDGEDDKGNDLPNNASRIKRYVEAGETYLLLVCGFHNEYGCYTLNWKMTDAPWGPWDVEEGTGVLWGYLGIKVDVSTAVVPDGVKTIGDYAFEDWGDLETVTLPSSVTKIWEDAFYGCHDLTTLNLSEGLVEICDYAFRGCGLGFLRLPSSVTTISANAFKGIDGEITVIAPQSLRGKLESQVMEFNKWNPYTGAYEKKYTKLTVLFGIHVPTEEAVPAATVASQYDGYLSDAAGNVVGTFTMKIGKANKKTNVSKASATVQTSGGRKTRYNGTFNAATGALEIPGLAASSFDANGITGTLGEFSLDGARNVFAAKDAASKASAQTAMNSCKGVFTVAWKDSGPWGAMSVSVGAKGKVKASGVLPNGKSVSSVAGQLLVGGPDVAMVPVVSAKKNLPLAFNIWFNGEGLALEGFAGESKAGKVGPLGNGLSASCDFLDAGCASCGISLPGGNVPVTVNGKKWLTDLPKSVGLKLTFTAKTGAFKGSFKQGKNKFTVNGVVVGGRGYGNATNKKVGTAAFVVE